MQATLDRFNAEYQTYEGLSKERVRVQLQELRRLCEHAGKPTPQDCDAADLRAYLSKLVADGLHVNTVRWKHRMLAPFFTWAYQVDLVGGEQLMAIKLVKDPKGATGRSDPKPYSPKELSKLWDDIAEKWPWDEQRWFRRYERGSSRYKRIANTVCRRQFEAVVALALEGGLRRIEIWSADIEHIHYDNTSIVVPQRGERASGKDKYREVPFTADARQALHDWLELRAWLKPKHDRPWVIGWANVAWGMELEPPSLKAFSNVPRLVGGWELHRMRHTCATNRLRSGMPIEVLQKVLGHATLEQTLAYAKLDRTDIEKAASKSESDFTRLSRRKR